MVHCCGRIRAHLGPLPHAVRSCVYTVVVLVLARHGAMRSGVVLCAFLRAYIHSHAIMQVRLARNACVLTKMEDKEVRARCAMRPPMQCGHPYIVATPANYGQGGPDAWSCAYAPGCMNRCMPRRMYARLHGRMCTCTHVHTCVHVRMQACNLADRLHKRIKGTKGQQRTRQS